MKVVINVKYGGFGLSRECRERMKQTSGKAVPLDDNIERHDAFLVEAIEALGSDACSTRFSQLAIVEIPDGVDYVIEEYDGLEHVAERHRTWS
jgi:hypothetical protein